MWSGLGMAALIAALVAGTSPIAYAQMGTEDPGRGGSAAPSRLGPSSITTSERGTTVFHGAPGNAAEVPGYGSSTGGTGYATSAGGTAVFHGAPGAVASTPGGNQSFGPPPPGAAYGGR